MADFRIIIDDQGGAGTAAPVPQAGGQTGAAQQAAAPQQPAPSAAADEAARLAAEPGDVGGGLSAADMAYIRGETQRLAEAEWDAGEADRQKILDELDAVSVEIYSAAEQAADQARQLQEIHDKRMEGLRALHDVEGAAAAEARRRLESRKEAREWEQSVKAEEMKQDPSGAAKEGLGGISGMLGQLLGGSGGGLGKMLQAAGGGLGKMLGGSGEALSGLLGGGGGAGGAAAAAEGAAGAAGGGLAGLAGSAAALAGPVGIAVAAVKLQASMMEGAFSAMRGMQAHFGDQAKSLISDDHMGMLTRQVDRAAETFGQIPLVGGAVKEFIGIFGDRLKILSEIQGEFIRLGQQRLAPFSGSLQASQAQAEVRQLVGDIRESQNIAAGIGRLVDAQSRSSDALRELSAPIKEILLEVSSLPAEAFAEVVSFIRDIARDTGALRWLFENVKDLADWARKTIGLQEAPPDGGLAAALFQFFGEGGRDSGVVKENPTNRLFGGF